GLLLARLWEPAPGTVFVGERDVTRLPRGALRVMLGYMPQEGFLFSRSIAENITLGREDADAARVREAAVAAGVADETDGFLAGFDTVVGDRGLTDRKSTRLNSSHGSISYAVFCLKKKRRRNDMERASGR